MFLWNEEIIPLEIAGVKSGNITFGNRYLGLNRPVKIDSPSVYLSTCKKMPFWQKEHIERKK
jgi:glycyl-tRNA synthetase beta subunit